jgi:hypothetical protein
MVMIIQRESNQKISFYRILLVEDDQERADILISYLPKNVRVVQGS